METANILIRTSSRPQGFENCINSIYKQDYPNIRIIAIYDNDKTLKYLNKYKCKKLKAKSPKKSLKPKGEKYGRYFPYNEYISQAQKQCEGYIFILDDDDMYIASDAISKVMKVAKPDHIVLWRVKLGNIVPPDDLWEQRIVKVCNISSIGMCYHSSQIHRTDWTQWKRADYRTASGFDKIIWLNELLSARQCEKAGSGRKKDVETCRFQL